MELDDIVDATFGTTIGKWNQWNLFWSFDEIVKYSKTGRIIKTRNYKE